MMRSRFSNRFNATTVFVILAAMFLIVGSGTAQDFDAPEHYTKSEHMVAMRDGAKLFTIVYEPKDRSGRYPVMLFRTPYSIGPYGPDKFRRRLGPSEEMAREGYIFVYQDVRGKFKSEGHFVVQRPLAEKPKGPRDADESTDTYDTIEWVLENVPNHNGRVGQWGVSYPAWQTVMGMIDAHPALVASSPQASPSDMFIGDDFHHNGAFRLMYTFSWLAGNAARRTGPSAERSPARFEYGTPDGYRFFLELGPVSNVNKLYFKDQVPTWNMFMKHGSYDEFWQQQNLLNYLNNIDHAVLNVAGWFDAEDFYGPMSIYYTLEEKNPENQSTLVVGPWLHGGWARGEGNRLGDIEFDSDTSVHYRQNIEAPFFRYHLKGEGEGVRPEAIVFETGSNEWNSYDDWPPREAQARRLYLRSGGRLSFDTPDGEPATDDATDEAFDSFISDPDKPVPFSATPGVRQGHLWMVEDQRFAARRPDVLVYESDVLTEDVTIAGPIMANLFVSTTGTDADWVVKLIDVYPGDAPDPDPNPREVHMGHFQMLLGGEVFRSKFRESFSEPKAMVPGEITEIRFDLRDKHHTFKRGHRIMVQVQSTWFPVIDRNPQKFVDIYHATEADFQKAEHRVYRSAAVPSHVEVLVLERE